MFIYVTRNGQQHYININSIESLSDREGSTIIALTTGNRLTVDGNMYYILSLIKTAD